MRVSRPLAALTGIALLGIALTACQDQASGQVTARNGVRYVETISNPPIHGCHRFRQGVTHVTNYTQSNMLLYTTPDCSVPPGGASIYLTMQSSDEVVRSSGLWRSFSFASG
ncbi:hypothetical protein [Streptomyces diastatochromogenes]|uniref:Uncharacterized protein n=1 Tax=Streptomyces diastatochromogenes TaxID=42236 RepID=A0A233SSX5_STRDA|nr:hypothetical protein [Streptomyces diastatochromogenes]MCZ0987623.1 hypothetical protein [Streptomyces diastatochromogenes]OXY98733.1 hypothetical protein BEK98_07815 [Streptomyces diastatochromogenes]